MLDSADLSLDETRAFLTERSHKKFGKIPTELIVRQVLAITEGADFPVRRAALEAIERRMDNAERDELHVVDSPKGTPWGEYQVARMAAQGGNRRRREHRPYVTTLDAVDPLSVSCNCQDYLKGSLGLCKHALCVLEHWYSTPTRIAQLQKSRAANSASNHPRLVWDPIWPLTGDADRLRGLSWHGSANGSATARVMKSGRLEIRVLKDPARRIEFLAQALADIRPMGRGRPAVVSDLGHQGSFGGRARHR